MRSSRISCLSLLLALSVVEGLAGCASTSPAPETPVEGDVDPLKISYFRAYAEPKTQKLEPSYRAVMSYGWKDRLGESPRDVLVKAAPKKLYTGFLSDGEMRKYVKLLKDYGIDALIARDTETLNPQELNRLALHPQETSFTRVITIATDKGSKSYYFRDQQRSKELIEKFVKCESFITRVTEYSMQVQVVVPEKERVIPRDR
ncbi:MAG TPA: hypothetical protein VF950_16525 [Planctomycetota bacterium]